ASDPALTLFPRLRSPGALAPTPPSQPFQPAALSLPLGPTACQDGRRQPATCLFGTQQPWHAPKNWPASSSNPLPPPNATSRFAALRSEEHTSELQSRFDLVGRLL